ncbi:hypothetical protein [Neisseria sicca]|uniref:hypothetical protein n=1 Tax=Neisseria sicca TaxID=490 RepID=UPI00396580A0
MLFQHTAARRRLETACRLTRTRTRFQHTAARRRLDTQPPEGGWVKKFQHTAARRRLGQGRIYPANRSDVSTHSRPKAAG